MYIHIKMDDKAKYPWFQIHDLYLVWELGVVYIISFSNLTQIDRFAYIL